MASNPGPYLLSATRLILNRTGSATPKPVTPNFYAELQGEFPSFAGLSLVAQNSFDEPWPTWEMHPKADEFVYLLSGDIDFVLWVDGAEQVIRVDQPGTYVVVPQGVWHTARPRTRTTMLFVTPGEGTQNAAVPG